MAGQSQTTTNSAPAWALPYWGSYLQGMTDLTQKPYQGYGGPRVADFSTDQRDAMGMISDRARSGGALRGDITNSLKGMFGGGSGSYGGGGGGYSGGGGTISVGKNPLLDTNGALLEDIIRRQGADVSRDYATGTAAQTDAMAARSGAFGGSAYQEMSQRNAEGLADRLAGASGQMRYGDLQARRALEEAALQRELEGKSVSAQTAAQRASASMAAGASRHNADLNAKMDALRLGMQLDDSAYRDADKLMGVGSLQQMYSQNLLDSDYGNWKDQQDHPFRMADLFGNAVSRATGGQGTQTSQTNTSANPWGTALGTGLSLAALYNMYSGK
jgi:hypothetical protein